MRRKKVNKCGILHDPEVGTEFSWSDIDTRTLKSFASKVKINDDGCWHWGGAKAKGGYGSIRVSGVLIGAHRLAWMLHNKKSLKKGTHICHICDNKHCVNPEHLFIGTPQDNIVDHHSKKNFAEISIENITKLVRLAIRASYNKGTSYTEIAQHHNLTPSHIHKVVQLEFVD